MDSVSPILSFDQNTNIDLLDSFPFADFQPDDFLLALSEDTDFLIDQISNNNKDCGAASRSGGGGNRRKLPEPISIPDAKDDQNPIDPKRKKMIHRDLERQRRQEMATLYGTLRSLLPSESLKGKRSTSDHMDQAVTYIKHMQKKMKELKEKRDELKMLSSIYCNSSSSVLPDPKSLHGCPLGLDTVLVRPCLGGKGVEVIISSALKQSLPLSNVLKALVEEGLTVVNCISTKVDQTLLHTIVSEVTSERVICPSKLKKKLEELALFSSRGDCRFD